MLQSDRFQPSNYPPIKSSVSENNFRWNDNRAIENSNNRFVLSENTRDRLRKSAILRQNFSDLPNSFSDGVLASLENGRSETNYILDWTATNDDVLSNHSNSTYSCY